MGQFTHLRGKLYELFQVWRADVASAIGNYRLRFEFCVFAKSNDDAADIARKPVAIALGDIRWSRYGGFPHLK
jgi:hypothetical protein